ALSIDGIAENFKLVQPQQRGRYYAGLGVDTASTIGVFRIKPPNLSLKYSFVNRPINGGLVGCACYKEGEYPFEFSLFWEPSCLALDYFFPTNLNTKRINGFLIREQ